MTRISRNQHLVALLFALGTISGAAIYMLVRYAS